MKQLLLQLVKLLCLLRPLQLSNTPEAFAIALFVVLLIIRVVFLRGIMLLQCRLHISHPFVQTLAQLALSKVEFLKLVIGSFKGTVVIEAANSHLIDHGFTDQILL